MEGSPAQFRAKVTGTPTPRIQWLREGALIPQSADFQVRITLLIMLKQSESVALEADPLKLST